jgi:hypothetical protein
MRLISASSSIEQIIESAIEAYGPSGLSVGVAVRGEVETAAFRSRPSKRRAAMPLWEFLGRAIPRCSFSGLSFAEFLDTTDTRLRHQLRTSRGHSVVRIAALGAERRPPTTKELPAPSGYRQCEALAVREHETAPFSNAREPLRGFARVSLVEMVGKEG